MLPPRATEMTDRDWKFPEARYLSYVLGSPGGHGPPLFIVLNAAQETIEITLPSLPEFNQWTVVLETAGEARGTKRSLDALQRARRKRVSEEDIEEGE